MPGTRREMAYAIVEADNPQELSGRVQVLLAQGFMPAGGMTAIGTVGLVGPQGPKFFQTMILVRDIPVTDEEIARHGMKVVEPSA